MTSSSRWQVFADTPKKGEFKISGRIIRFEQLYGDGCCIASVVHAQFLVQALDVAFYSFRGDKQLCGNFLVLQALRQ